MNKPKLRLPRQASDDFAVLKDLDEAKVSDFVRALNDQLSVSMEVDTRVEGVVSSVWPDESPGLHERITRAVISLHFLHLSGREDVGVLATGLAQMLCGESEEGQKPIERTVQSILSVSAIQASAKAWSLIDEYDNVYVSARVISDIRPIFSDPINEALSGSLIVHSLRITSKTNGTNESFYLALDDGDVKDLQEQLTRALAKSIALKNIINKAPANIFGPALGD